MFAILMSRKSNAGTPTEGTTLHSYLESFQSLRFIPRFFKLIWLTDRKLFAANATVRLLSAFLPVIILWVGKEIIDEVILQAAADAKDLARLWTLVLVELGLAIVSDISGRFTGLTDGLLGDLYGNLSQWCL